MSTNSNLSTHAARRLQQRAIPAFMLDLLDEFGTAHRSNRADRLFFDKHARKRLRKHLPDPIAFRSIERWLSVYAVVGDDGTVVTVAHRTHRFRRP